MSSWLFHRIRDRHTASADAPVTPAIEAIQQSSFEGRYPRQAALFRTQIVGRYVYDTCGKTSRRLFWR